MSACILTKYKTRKIFLISNVLSSSHYNLFRCTLIQKVHVWRMHDVTMSHNACGTSNMAAKSAMSQVASSAGYIDVALVMDGCKLLIHGHCFPMQYWRQRMSEVDRVYAEALNSLNIAFTTIFAIESILKIIAFGPQVWIHTVHQEMGGTTGPYWMWKMFDGQLWLICCGLGPASCHSHSTLEPPISWISNIGMLMFGVSVLQLCIWNGLHIPWIHLLLADSVLAFVLQCWKRSVHMSAQILA